MTDPTAALNRDHDSAERLRYVYSQRPRCPACGSVELKAYRTVRTGDETITRYVRCRQCGQRTLLVLE